MTLATPTDMNASAQVRQGAIELRLIGDDGTEQPWDGKPSPLELRARFEDYKLPTA